MSLNLLPVRTGHEQVEVAYKNFLPASVTLNTTASAISHRMLYTAYMISNTKLMVYRLNLVSNVNSLVGEISWSNLGSQYVGSILVDDTFLYVSSISKTEIRKYRLDNNLSLEGTYTYSTTAPQAYGKMMWNMNKSRIIIGYNNGFLFYNPMNNSFDYKSNSTTFNFSDFSVGNKYILADRSSSDSSSLMLYDIENDSFEIKAILQSGAVTVSSYFKGSFYITNANYLYILNEETLSLQTIPVQWSLQPRTINVVNDNVFVTISNSAKVYVYNYKINANVIITLPWTIRGYNANYSIINTTYGTNIFIPYFKLAQIGNINSAKYNFGPVVDYEVIYFTETYKNNFTYDPRFITFTDSCMLMHDGIIEKTFVEIDSENHFKKCSISKNEYKHFKNFSAT